MTIGLALLFYALPRLPQATWSLEGAFTIAWLSFSVLIIGANLYQLIGVDKERQASRKQQRAWFARGVHEFQRGYFPDAKREMRQQKQRRFMS